MSALHEEATQAVADMPENLPGPLCAAIVNAVLSVSACTVMAEADNCRDVVSNSWDAGYAAGLTRAARLLASGVKVGGV